MSTFKVLTVIEKLNKFRAVDLAESGHTLHAREISRRTSLYLDPNSRGTWYALIGNLVAGRSAVATTTTSRTLGR